MFETYKSKIMVTKSALLVIDIQYDFLPEGSLAVQDGEKIMPGVLDLLDPSKYHWDAVALSQDWHPKDHTSFASNHANVKPFEQVEFTSTKDPTVKSWETVWPNHCVQHCRGSSFPDELITAYKNVEASKTIIQKGVLQDRDYYSAFNDIWDDNKTGLDSFLKKNGITHVFLVGLAYDYCVKFSAESSSKLGYKTFVIKPLSKAINTDKITETDDYYEKSGVTIINDINDGTLKSVKKE